MGSAGRISLKRQAQIQAPISAPSLELKLKAHPLTQAGASHKAERIETDAYWNWSLKKLIRSTS